MNRGFTLIETIVYLALMSVLIGGALTAFYSITSSVADDSDSVSTESEGMFVLSKIDAAMGAATDFVVSNDMLTVYTESETIRFAQTGDAVTITRDGHAEPLTTENVIVTAFSVDRIAGNGVTVSVTIDGIEFTTTNYL